jgi:2-dehydropantoate 2-reductase
MTGNARIAVVGCGALGSFYGAHLCRDGRNVHFLLRSDYEHVRQRGVTIIGGKEVFVVRPHAARDPAQIGVSDLILIGLKTTANDQFERLLKPLVGSQTALLTLQNGLGNEELLAALFGAERVLGGLCFVCLNRESPGVIRHFAHGRVVLGEFGRVTTSRTLEIAALFVRAGIPCDATDHLEQAHWEKLVWNIPFNGLGVASAAGYSSVVAGRVLQPDQLGPCLTTDRLLAEPQWEALVRELMRETIHAAQAQGLAVSESEEEVQIGRTRDMGAYRASTLIDFEHGLPLEVESLFVEPLRRARRAGVLTPRLEALCAVLRQIDVLPARHAVSQ